MRSVEDYEAVVALIAEGLNTCEIERRTGIPRTTIRHWRHGTRRTREETGPPCSACGKRRRHPDPLPAAEYAYLLGLYLGDGHIATHRRGVYRLRITLDDRYPGIIEECARAMEAVIGRAPGFLAKIGCTDVNTYSRHWACLLPQHGAGPKHERFIVLADWQQEMVDEHPQALLRGLIHSDGWRGTNRVTVRGKAYAYPRYTFTNVSDDIRRIFCDACDAVGVEWRQMNARNISVAKRDSVARMDEFIGLKR